MTAALERAALIYHTAAPVPGTPAEVRAEIFSRALRMVTKAAGTGTPSAVLSAAGVTFEAAAFSAHIAHKRGGDFLTDFQNLVDRARAAG